MVTGVLAFFVCQLLVLSQPGFEAGHMVTLITGKGAVKALMLGQGGAAHGHKITGVTRVGANAVLVAHVLLEHLLGLGGVGALVALEQGLVGPQRVLLVAAVVVQHEIVLAFTFVVTLLTLDTGIYNLPYNSIINIYSTGGKLQTKNKFRNFTVKTLFEIFPVFMLLIFVVLKRSREKLTS